MNLRDHCITMHRYHRWAFGRLYQTVHALSDEDYRRDVGLFFGSVHRTLNHLLLVDRVWRGRVDGAPRSYTSLDQELEVDRAALEQAIYAECDAWLAFLEGVPRARFDSMQAFRSLAGKELEMPFATLVLHATNHGTHHRGQISAALTQFGLQAPAMDLLYHVVDF
jgi:uncharacterized damage-inducible protein DinB